MHHLVAAADGVAPGRQPHGDPVMHGLRGAQEVADQEAAEQCCHSRDSQPGAVARDGVEREKDAGEYERGAEIFL